jgi:hypothetical protein
MQISAPTSRDADVPLRRTILVAVVGSGDSAIVFGSCSGLSGEVIAIQSPA